MMKKVSIIHETLKHNWIDLQNCRKFISLVVENYRVQLSKDKYLLLNRIKKIAVSIVNHTISVSLTAFNFFNAKNRHESVKLSLTNFNTSVMAKSNQSL